MPVNTPPPGPPNPELRHDGGGTRAGDVLIAIVAAHGAGAFAGDVRSIQYRDARGHITGGRLHVHLATLGDPGGYASAGQALAVLIELGVDRSDVASRELNESADGIWAHEGTTDDGLKVTVYALGPVDGQS